MKMIIIFFIAAVAFLFYPKRKAPPPEPALVSKAADSINFKTGIEPILRKKCTPCHFEGGKMYGRMPFDRPETIVAFKDKIPTRIKDSNELRLISNFVRQQMKNSY